ncbi:MAG: hypothetical protein WAM14_24820 [Candidatus Nitrosopolaris sp.]
MPAALRNATIDEDDMILKNIGSMLRIASLHYSDDILALSFLT